MDIGKIADDIVAVVAGNLHDEEIVRFRNTIKTRLELELVREEGFEPPLTRHVKPSL